MTSLVLGTVQLGIPYGIANATGQPDLRTAIEIVRAAWEGGVHEFDTAQDYGESEKVLGVAFKQLGIENEARVITKLAKDVDLNNTEAVFSAVQQSIVNLGVSKLYALLLHKEELLDEIKDWKKPNIIEHFGVSVYSPERASQALKMDGIDVIQIPTNILDRRFENAGVYARANKNKKQVYIRSAFLQGLILMNPNNLPEHMVFARPVLEQIIKLAKEFKISSLEMALGYLKTSAPEARVIVGAETPEQIREIITAWGKDFPMSLVERVREEFSKVDEYVLDPRKWPILHLQHLVTTQKSEKADAIVWLQGNMYDRGTKVLELYHDEFAPLIVVTGNNTRVVEDDDVHINDIIDWLKDRGIDKSAILVDDQSINTLNQAQNVLRIAEEHKWTKLILVGSTHHQLRAFLTFLHQAKKIGWQGRIINQPAHIDWDAKPSGLSKTARELFQEEIERLEKYKENMATVEEGIKYLKSRQYAKK